MARRAKIFAAAGLFAVAGALSPAARVYEGWASLFIARTLRTSGLPSASLPFYTLAMTLVPSAHQIPQARGAAFQAMSLYDRAIADYTRAIELNPDDPDAWHFRAAALALAGRREDAVADYSEAVARAPQVPVHRYHRARLHLAMGHRDLAAADLNAILGASADPRWKQGAQKLLNKMK